MSEPDIQTQIVNAIRGNSNIKEVIEGTVKDFICANGKVLDPVIEHVQKKLDESFTKINQEKINKILDNVIEKISPSTIETCLKECLDKAKNNTKKGGKHNKTKKKINPYINEFPRRRNKTIIR